MQNWLEFEGRIEPLVWGRGTYTILRLPAWVSTSLQAQNTKRVEGEIADFPVNLGLAKSPEVDGVFLWTGKSLLDQIGVVPGHALNIRLRPTDPDHVDTPSDVNAALSAADVTHVWTELTPGKRRGLLHQVQTAKRAETRNKRIAALVSHLKDAP
ncbi:MAG: YdeI/OmpD-associated family protein [Pseudomonadota bacterium]